MSVSKSQFDSFENDRSSLKDPEKVIPRPIKIRRATNDLIKLLGEVPVDYTEINRKAAQIAGLASAESRQPSARPSRRKK